MNPIGQIVDINIDGITLHGSLILPNESKSVLVFVQGVGGGRFSPRNNHIAAQLQKNNIATLLIDLLTPGERNLFRTHNSLSNINWLYNRLEKVLDWLHHQEHTASMTIALFGSNLGAAAALKTAADRQQHITAVISWSGRPEQVKDSLEKITAPTLLIVGAFDQTLVKANREAVELFRAPCFLEIIPNTSFSLKEPGKVEALAQLCSDWLPQHLPTTK